VPKNSNKPSNWQLSDFKVDAVEGKSRFHDLVLTDEIMHAIHDLGFEYCTAIQAQALPYSLRGKDTIGKAQTGTGKSAAFLITVIDDLILNPVEHERYLREPRALVIAPTRELAVQIAADAKDLCKYCDLSISTLIGGENYDRQKHEMDNRFVDIVVATPGRLLDFVSRGDLHVDMVESLVLDEADRMLDMGFIPQIKRIIGQIPNCDSRQTQLFSATFTEDILNLTKRWTHDAVFVEVEPEHVATDSVEQKVYLVSKEHKRKMLINILKDDATQSAIVFTNRRDQSQRLYEAIKNAGLEVGILTGEISQQKRSKTLENFKAGKINVLVATDVVGRGIHIDNVSHVINYNLPEDPEDYVHRIGRTGRADATGISISLACEDESFELPAIEELLGEKLKCEVPPEELYK
jgi:ATP-dependent RNA helicase RhlB